MAGGAIVECDDVAALFKVRKRRLKPAATWGREMWHVALLWNATM
ncbi:MAG: hypothetical protein V3S81_00265 [Anaerolineales bacterium]